MTSSVITADDRYDQLFEQSPGAILTIDPDGHITDCNQSCCLLLVQSRGELIGTPVLQWVLPGERAASKDLFLRAFAGEVVEWRTKIRRGDGAVRTLALRVVPLGRAGAVEAVNAFVREPAHERVGRPDQVRLLGLLENLPGQFVAVLDASGRIRYSSGLARTHWIEDADCIGRDFGSLLETGEENRQLYDGLRAETLAGQRWVGTLWHLRADGSRFPARSFAVPHRDGASDEVLGTLIAGRDAAAEHETAAALERAQRLAAVGEIVVSIARELAPPLARIQDCAQTLRQDHGELQAHDRFAELVGEADRAASFVESLDAFAADVQIERRGCAIPDLVGAALAEEAEALERAQVHWSHELPPDLPLLHGDAAQLRRLLRMLIENAREAIEEQADGQIRIDVVRYDAIVVVRVQDNGPGVREDRRERIFEPFFTTKTRHLGLGLALAQAIARMHGGRVWVDRSPDGWTRFCLELRAAAQSEPAASPVAFRAVPLVLSRDRSILLVDDEETVRTVVRLSLERVGYRVTEAWSGRSALACITSASPPDLIITDLRMSDGNGYWLLEQLMRDFPDLLRRTIIVTGHPAHAKIEAVARETGCPVLPKPLDFSLLFEALDEVAKRI